MPADSAATAPTPAEQAQQAAPAAAQQAAPQQAPAQAAPEMPKDDDWDLPEGMDGGAFVPIEAE
jgi:hypothetical protein